MRKFKATGSDALGEALAAALRGRGTKVVASMPRREYKNGESHIPQDVLNDLAKRDQGDVVVDHNPNSTNWLEHEYKNSPPVPPLAERRKREQQGNIIKKHSAVIKRLEPRLFHDLLQTFGSIEGLNTAKQAELIERLVAIRKEYRI